MKFHSLLLSAAAAAYISPALAAVTAEEASQLGKTLTACGAEIAGNKAGTIPAYTGGLTKAPANFKPASGKWPDPFPDDKPLYTITAQNYMQHADKLTEGNKELFKRNPTYRMEVYPTRRTAAVSKRVEEACLTNAKTGKLINNGLKVVDAKAAIPFPIPKTGIEVMWNHLLTFQPINAEVTARSYYVPFGDKPILASKQWIKYYYQWNDPEASDYLVNQRGISVSTEPNRMAGQWVSYYDQTDSNRKSWVYLPGQRRVRATPDADFDTPVTTQGGAIFYDDVSLFYGSPARFDFKLVGKKELLIPYNNYTLTFNTPPEKAMGPNFVNPDLVRWELHRVFVVEATVKPGMRHSYGKRIFYFDEDSFGGGASDNYDQSGKLFRSLFAPTLQLYADGNPVPVARPFFFGYDFSSNVYVFVTHTGSADGFLKLTPKAPLSDFGPDAMVRMGVR